MSYRYICDRCGVILEPSNATYCVAIENVNGTRSSLSKSHLCQTCREDLALFLNAKPVEKAARWKQVQDER